MNTAALPAGYRELEKIDLQKDKKLAIWVNVLALVVMALLIVLGSVVMPFQTYIGAVVQQMLAWEIEPLLGVLLLVLGLLIGIVAYVLLHEIVHGVFMKAFSHVKPHYGFTGLYAYAGSSAFFDRKSYIIIALAPVVIWGVVLAVLQAALPAFWFWLVYFIQIMNLSGAAGDLYVTVKMMKMPKDILVNDVGVSMTVYSKEDASC
ncbi:MAG: DUF3267 domain-containing protein [Eubacteriales bacterium]|nr:DUF3267 domain-containing protein [Eubacteriales bacterium]